MAHQRTSWEWDNWNSWGGKDRSKSIWTEEDQQMEQEEEESWHPDEAPADKGASKKPVQSKNKDPRDGRGDRGRRSKKQDERDAWRKPLVEKLRTVTKAKDR